MAKLLEIALVTFRFACNAHQPTVMDDLVREVDPAILRDDLH